MQVNCIYEYQGKNSAYYLFIYYLLDRGLGHNFIPANSMFLCTLRGTQKILFYFILIFYRLPTACGSSWAKPEPQQVTMPSP